MYFIIDFVQQLTTIIIIIIIYYKQCFLSNRTGNKIIVNCFCLIRNGWLVRKIKRIVGSMGSA